jgi:hypothetical protein
MVFFFDGNTSCIGEIAFAREIKGPMDIKYQNKFNEVIQMKKKKKTDHYSYVKHINIELNECV